MEARKATEQDGKLAYMDNTALLDVFDAAQGEVVSRLGNEAVLGPGDLLVLPPKWWHAFQSLEASCSVSMWY